MSYRPSSGMSPTQSSTAVPATFETTTRPRRSRIGPRGASTRISRSWLLCAAFRYSSPESTWRDQSRKKRTMKTASARAPSIADAQRELRCETVRLAHPRVGREEATGRGSPFLVRPGRHLRRRPRHPPTARHAAPRPRSARTSRCTGSASSRLRTKAGASEVTSACLGDDLLVRGGSGARIRTRRRAT